MPARGWSASGGRKVMVFGTFDSLHPGHLNFFQQARKYGDYLIVIIARDVNVKKIKGCYPDLSEKERQKSVAQTKKVAKAILGYKINRFKIIKKIKPDVICLGYDQRIKISELENKLEELKLKVDIYRLAPYKPDKYKSSIIKNNLK